MPKHENNFKMEVEKYQENELIWDLEEIARDGARIMLQRAMEIEINEYLNEHKELKTADGKLAIVRNGYQRERKILAGCGAIDVKVPRTRNREGNENFESVIIPPYMRKSLKIEEAIPILYLYGVSEKDMKRSLAGLLGDGVKGLSASSVSRMKLVWEKTYREWRERRFEEKRYAYVWVDGIYFNVQGSADRLCNLVIIGVNDKGEKEIIAVEEGYRESSETWEVILRNLKEKGLNAPKLFIGDGSLGFWKAAKVIYPETKWQRCWVHKTRNVLDKLPKILHTKAKEMLAEIYNSPDKDSALKAYSSFVATFFAKYPKAVECLKKDLEQLLEFYNFPAEHWIHIRSTNAIESTFSTVRLRTKKMRGCGSKEGLLAMVFQLLNSASKRWKKLRGYEKVDLVLNGSIFENGELKAA